MASRTKGKYCCVFACHNRTDRDLEFTFHRLPSLPKHPSTPNEFLIKQRRELWIKNLSLSSLTARKLENVRVCSKHFVGGQPAPQYEPENPSWAPTLHLGHKKQVKGSLSERFGRGERLKARNLKEVSLAATVPLQGVVLEPVTSQFNNDHVSAAEQELGEVVFDSNSLAGSVQGENSQDIQLGNVGTSVRTFCDMGVQTDLTFRQIADLEKECEKNRASVAEYTMEDSVLQKDERRLAFYTGLSCYALFSCLLNYVCPESERDKRKQDRRFCLSQSQELLITLMKLRLHLSFTDLAYRFGVCKSTVSRIFTRTVSNLYCHLKPLIRWPHREDLRKTMPISFRLAFDSRVAVIMDCFEVFTERPSSLDSRAECWSNYKHRYTVKFLIGIAPQGVIIFLSGGWTGRTSDRHLTLQSNILDNLLPNDVVLADRGFLVEEDVAARQAELNLPAFTVVKGKKKTALTPMEIQRTRQIANLRIHVERVIGTLRQKYKILNGTLSKEVLLVDENRVPFIDKIASVCASLCNLCPSVVDFN